MYLYVSICIYMYLYVSICIYMYLYLSAYVSAYVSADMYLIYVLYVCNSMVMTQEPIDWSYRFHICLAYFSGLCKGICPTYGQKYGTNVPPF